MITFPKEEMHSRTYNLGLILSISLVWLSISLGLDDGIENIPVKPAYDSYLGGAA